MNTRPSLTAQQVKPLFEKLSKLEQEFNFDWNDYNTFKPNANLVAEVETLLNEVNQLKDLSPEHQLQIGALDYGVALAQLGPLNYKLGTYYNHIQRDPDKALIYLHEAKSLLTGNHLAWLFNHIAYSYQQKIAMTEDAKQRQVFYKLARDEYNHIIDNYVYATPGQRAEMRIFAFAMCVKAQSEYATNDVKSAQLSYRHALECYEAINDKDDQYARTLRRYAVITAQLGLEIAAKDHFEELRQYWQDKPVENPYLGQFYETFADYIVESDPKQASTALQYYRVASTVALGTGDLNRSEMLQDKMENLRNQISAAAEKQLPKIGFHKPAPNQLSIDEPIFQNEYKR